MLFTAHNNSRSENVIYSKQYVYIMNIHSCVKVIYLRLTYFEFSCSRLNRTQHQNLENHLTTLCRDVSSLSLERRSERIATVTTSLLEPDQHRKAVRAEILRVACSISNPVYRVGFEKAANQALNNMFNSMETESSKDDRTVEMQSHNERNAGIGLQDGSMNHDNWRKDRFSRQYYTSEHLFGTFYVENETFTLRSCRSDELDMRHYMYQTSFAFTPALWLIKLGFNYAIRLEIERSDFRGWKHKMEIARPVPDVALIFEFCEEGNMAGVRSLLSRGEASVRDVDSLGRTPLYVSPVVCS